MGIFRPWAFAMQGHSHLSCWSSLSGTRLSPLESLVVDCRLDFAAMPPGKEKWDLNLLEFFGPPFITDSPEDLATLKFLIPDPESREMGEIP